MSVHLPDRQLDYDRWKAERERNAAREARRLERARSDLPFVPGPLRVWLVGLFGALALAMVCAAMWGG